MVLHLAVAPVLHLAVVGLELVGGVAVLLPSHHLVLRIPPSRLALHLII